MHSDERQAVIWDIILQRKFETVPNLARELGVCIRTIYGDISKMKEKYPIEAISGKYGGVYLVHEPNSISKRYACKTRLPQNDSNQTGQPYIFV